MAPDDGMIQVTTACQAAFDFDRDVPTCGGDRNGTCLSAAQKGAIAPIFPERSAATEQVYASFQFDSAMPPRLVVLEFFVPLKIDSAATA